MIHEQGQAGLIEAGAPLACSYGELQCVQALQESGMADTIDKNNNTAPPTMAARSSSPISLLLYTTTPQCKQTSYLHDDIIRC
jgi:hypothetical protein